MTGRKTVRISEGKTYVSRQDENSHVVVLKIEVIATVGANYGVSTQVSYVLVAREGTLSIQTMPSLQFALNYQEL